MASMADYQQLFKTTEETKVPEVGKVTGTLPTWLNGSYLRIGPGKFDFTDFTMNHVFDGYSVITKFDISGKRGQVTIEKRYLDTVVFKKASITQKPVTCEFGTRGYQNDPTKNMLTKWIPTLIPDLTDNCNLGLYQLGTQFIAGCDTCHFHELNPNQLCSTAKFDTSKLFGTHTFTCHPIRDPETGITYNFGSSILTGVKYNLIQIPPTSSPTASTKDMLKKAKVLCSFPSSWTNCFSYSHSFGMTKNYIIFIEQPYVLVVSRILAAVVTKGHSFQNWVEWRSELRNNFWLIEKATGKLLKVNYQSEDPFFFLHIINCFEESGNIVIDLTAFPNANGLESMTLDKLRAGIILNDKDKPVGQRFVLPIVQNYDEIIENYRNNRSNDTKNGISGPIDMIEDTNLITTIKTEAIARFQTDKIVLKPEIVTEKGIELPSINTNYIGRKYKYFYASGCAMDGYFENAICKVNLVKKNTTLWREEKRQDSSFAFMGEPLFVPRPKPSCNSNTETRNEVGDEDDGIILCPASTTTPQTQDEYVVKKSTVNFLLVLDAKSFKEIARVNFEAGIPVGLHGIFSPA